MNRLGSKVVKPLITEEATKVYKANGGFEWMMTRLGQHAQHVAAILKKAPDHDNANILSIIDGLCIAQLNRGAKIDIVVIEQREFERDGGLTMFVKDAQNTKALVDIKVF
jgi:hypothetical protein